MGFETPKMLTPEEMAKIEKERTINDAKMLSEGADYVYDNKGNKRLEATELQFRQSAHEMNESMKLSEADKIFEKSSKDEQAIITALGEHAYLSSMLNHIESVALNIKGEDVNGYKLEYIYKNMKEPLMNMLKTILQLAKNQNIEVDPKVAGTLVKNDVMELMEIMHGFEEKSDRQ